MLVSWLTTHECGPRFLPRDIVRITVCHPSRCQAELVSLDPTEYCDATYIELWLYLLVGHSGP